MTIVLVMNLGFAWGVGESPSSLGAPSLAWTAEGILDYTAQGKLDWTAEGAKLDWTQPSQNEEV